VTESNGDEQEEEEGEGEEEEVSGEGQESNDGGEGEGCFLFFFLLTTFVQDASSSLSLTAADAEAVEEADDDVFDGRERGGEDDAVHEGRRVFSTPAEQEEEEPDVGLRAQGFDAVEALQVDILQGIDGFIRGTSGERGRGTRGRRGRMGVSSRMDSFLKSIGVLASPAQVGGDWERMKEIDDSSTASASVVEVY
jgi:hypothetical protein